MAFRLGAGARGVRGAATGAALALSTACSEPPRDAPGVLREPFFARADDDIRFCPPSDAPRLPRGEADAVFAKLSALYAPDAAAGGKPLLFAVEPDAFFAAWAFDRDATLFGHEPAFRIWVTEGLLSEPGMTADILAHVLCHELGHAFGGFPFLAGGNASEGQADYYAAKDCLPRLFAGEHARNAAARDTVQEPARTLCDGAWPDRDAQSVCYRVVAAGEQARRLTQSVTKCDLEPPPSIATPATHAVRATEVGQLSLQCATDTVLAGALCNVKNPPLRVPGLTSEGKVERDAERAAAPYACHVGPGARPRCWFLPGAVPCLAPAEPRAASPIRAAMVSLPR